MKRWRVVVSVMAFVVLSGAALDATEPKRPPGAAGPAAAAPTLNAGAVAALPKIFSAYPTGIVLSFSSPNFNHLIAGWAFTFCSNDLVSDQWFGYVLNQNGVWTLPLWALLDTSGAPSPACSPGQIKHHWAVVYDSWPPLAGKYTIRIAPHGTPPGAAPSGGVDVPLTLTVPLTVEGLPADLKQLTRKHTP